MIFNESSETTQDNSKQEVKEKNPKQDRAQYLTSGEKLRATLNDPATKEAFFATLRTLVNIGISIIDLVPGIGELPSWVADAIKVTKEAKKKNFANRIKGNNEKNPDDFWQKIDPTPDVPVWIALGSEVGEAVSGTAFPSHAVESTVQFAGYDLGRITAGLKRLKEIWGEQEGNEVIKEIGQKANNELTDYQNNQIQINSAMQAFA